MKLLVILFILKLYAQLHIFRKEGDLKPAFRCLRSPALLKSNSNTVIFLRILRKFYEQLFLQSITGGCLYW